MDKQVIEGGRRKQGGHVKFGQTAGEWRLTKIHEKQYGDTLPVAGFVRWRGKRHATLAIGRWQFRLGTHAHDGFSGRLPGAIHDNALATSAIPHGCDDGDDWGEPIEPDNSAQDETAPQAGAQEQDENVPEGDLLAEYQAQLADENGEPLDEKLAKIANQVRRHRNLRLHVKCWDGVLAWLVCRSTFPTFEIYPPHRICIISLSSDL